MALGDAVKKDPPKAPTGPGAPTPPTRDTYLRSPEEIRVIALQCATSACSGTSVFMTADTVLRNAEKFEAYLKTGALPHVG